MKKYYIYKRTVEIKYADRFEIEQGCTADDPEPEKVAEFDSLEEARSELKKYESSIYKFSSAIGTMYEVTECIIQEVEVDEDGDIEDLGDVWDFSEFKIEVEDESYNVVATFGSFQEAERFANDSDEELRIAF